MVLAAAVLLIMGAMAGALAATPREIYPMEYDTLPEPRAGQYHYLMACVDTRESIASTQGNPLFDYAGRSLTHLVTRGKGIPEYFMLDVMLSVAYTRHAEFTAMIDAIPANN